MDIGRSGDTDHAGGEGDTDGNRQRFFGGNRPHLGVASGFDAGTIPDVGRGIFGQSGDVNCRPQASAAAQSNRHAPRPEAQIGIIGSQNVYALGR